MNWRKSPSIVRICPCSIADLQKKFSGTMRWVCQGDMVIDTSAVLAIMLREPERRRFIEAIEASDSIRMSVASFVESSMVIESRYGAEGLRDLDRFISRAGIELMPVDV